MPRKRRPSGREAMTTDEVNGGLMDLLIKESDRTYGSRVWGDLSAQIREANRELQDVHQAVLGTNMLANKAQLPVHTGERRPFITGKKKPRKKDPSLYEYFRATNIPEDFGDDFEPSNPFYGFKIVWDIISAPFKSFSRNRKYKKILNEELDNFENADPYYVDRSYD